eukprot:3594156-Rhodomonas_salina.2
MEPYGISGICDGICYGISGICYGLSGTEVPCTRSLPDKEEITPPRLEPVRLYEESAPILEESERASEQRALEPLQHEEIGWSVGGLHSHLFSKSLSRALAAPPAQTPMRGGPTPMRGGPTPTKGATPERDHKAKEGQEGDSAGDSSQEDKKEEEGEEEEAEEVRSAASSRSAVAGSALATRGSIAWASDRSMSDRSDRGSAAGDSVSEGREKGEQEGASGTASPKGLQEGAAWPTEGERLRAAAALTIPCRVATDGVSHREMSALMISVGEGMGRRASCQSQRSPALSPIPGSEPSHSPSEFR